MIDVPNWGEFEHIVRVCDEKWAVKCNRCGEVSRGYDSLLEAQGARFAHLTEDCFYHSEDENERRRRWPTWFELLEHRGIERLAIPGGLGAFAPDLHKNQKTAVEFHTKSSTKEI